MVSASGNNPHIDPAALTNVASSQTSAPANLRQSQEIDTLGQQSIADFIKDLQAPGNSLDNHTGIPLNGEIDDEDTPPDRPPPSIKASSSYTSSSQVAEAHVPEFYEIDMPPPSTPPPLPPQLKPSSPQAAPDLPFPTEAPPPPPSPKTYTSHPSLPPPPDNLTPLESTSAPPPAPKASDLPPLTTQNESQTLKETSAPEKKNILKRGADFGKTIGRELKKAANNSVDTYHGINQTRRTGLPRLKRALSNEATKVKDAVLKFFGFSNKTEKNLPSPSKDTELLSTGKNLDPDQELGEFHQEVSQKNIKAEKDYQATLTQGMSPEDLKLQPGETAVLGKSPKFLFDPDKASNLHSQLRTSILGGVDQDRVAVKVGSPLNLDTAKQMALDLMQEWRLSGEDGGAGKVAILLLDSDGNSFLCENNSSNQTGVSIGGSFSEDLFTLGVIGNSTDMINISNNELASIGLVQQEPPTKRRRL